MAGGHRLSGCLPLLTSQLVIEGTCGILVLHSSHVVPSQAQPQRQQSLVHDALLAGERQRIFRCRRLRHLSRLYLVDAWPQLACGDAAVCSNSLEGILREGAASEARCGIGQRVSAAETKC